ncbi:preprotein translocase subunit SecD [Enterobacter cloacae]|nr:preprotein translocase subunit SecD [Enterobacter cloacae]
MSNFTKDNIGKPMATLFVEYKDSGKKDANGRAVLVKEESAAACRCADCANSDC